MIPDASRCSARYASSERKRFVFGRARQWRFSRLKRPTNPAGTAKAELPHDIVLDGHGEGDDGSVRSLRYSGRKVCPHRDAVRLVDGDEPEV